MSSSPWPNQNTDAIKSFYFKHATCQYLTGDKIGERDAYGNATQPLRSMDVLTATGDNVDSPISQNPQQSSDDKYGQQTIFLQLQFPKDPWRRDHYCRQGIQIRILSWNLKSKKFCNFCDINNYPHRVILTFW